ncbi:MAG: tRNA pseudouridine(55) synthase TruB [Acidobacteria bacterium]|nr:tRNA pseudouridine(55) synthase TruB [Acidobacteriota bacterium]
MSRRRPSRWHGLLPVAKLAGPTSHDVVDMARKALKERRIGHTGTLDPMAEGLLILCVGTATRLQQYLLAWDKTYEGRIRLGGATTTYDREGEAMEPAGPAPSLDEGALRELETRFSGEIDQVPPPFSAKKVDGKKLYELAREGREVHVEPKRVTVQSLRLELVEPGMLHFEVRTSSGFYVRSLAHDIGVHLGCGGHLEHLKRLRIGPYTAEAAISQEHLQAAGDPQEILEDPAWIPLEDLALPYPELTLNPGAEERFRHGGEVILLRQGEETFSQGDLAVLRGRENRLVGIGTVTNVLARGRTVVISPKMVLQRPEGS